MKTSLADIIAGLDLTAEEKAAAQSLLTNEKVRGKIDGELKNVQSEFSRHADETKAAQAKAQADKDAYYAQMDNWKKEQEARITAATEGARKATETYSQYKARMDGLVASGILTKEDIDGLPDIAAPVKKSVEEPVADPNAGRYVTQEEGRQYLSYPALLQDIAAEHYALTGKPLTNMSEIVAEAQKVNGSKTLRQVWEEKNGIPGIREEHAKKAQQEHDEKIRREERTKVMSEVSNPTSRPTNTTYNSPVLASAAKAVQNAIPNSGSRQGVERALAAHAAGKYADGVVHAQ